MSKELPEEANAPLEKKDVSQEKVNILSSLDKVIDERNYLTQQQNYFYWLGKIEKATGEDFSHEEEMLWEIMTDNVVLEINQMQTKIENGEPHLGIIAHYANAFINGTNRIEIPEKLKGVSDSIAAFNIGYYELSNNTRKMQATYRWLGDATKVAALEEESVQMEEKDLLGAMRGPTDAEVMTAKDKIINLIGNINSAMKEVGLTPERIAEVKTEFKKNIRERLG